MTTIAEVTPAPIEFVAGEEDIRVTARAVRFTVRKEMSHDVTCGNKKWFEPLSTVHHADLGITARTHSAARRSARDGAIPTSAPGLQHIFLLTWLNS